MHWTCAASPALCEDFKAEWLVKCSITALLCGHLLLCAPSRPGGARLSLYMPITAPHFLEDTYVAGGICEPMSQARSNISFLCTSCAPHYDSSTEHLNFAFPTGKGYGGNSKGKRTSKNKLGKGGEVMKCHNGGSEYHLQAQAIDSPRDVNRCQLSNFVYNHDGGPSLGPRMPALGDSGQVWGRRCQTGPTTTRRPMYIHVYTYNNSIRCTCI